MDLYSYKKEMIENHTANTCGHLVIMDGVAYRLSACDEYIDGSYGDNIEDLEKIGKWKEGRYKYVDSYPQ